MFYVGTEWLEDNIRIHFQDSDGEHVQVTMNAHDSVEFEVSFTSWMTRNKDRLLDVMRRADRRKDIVT